MALSSATAGGGGKQAAIEKTRSVLNSGELSEDQHFLALGFESEGYVSEEAKKLLHAWAKLHKEANDLTNARLATSLNPAGGPHRLGYAGYGHGGRASTSSAAW